MGVNGTPEHATMRLQTPQIKAELSRHGLMSFSMDEERLYGPTFYELNFGRAIELGLIADYEIVLSFISEAGDDVLKYLDRLVAFNDIQVPLSREDVFFAILLSKTIEQGITRKAITFQNLVERAQVFAHQIK